MSAIRSPNLSAFARKLQRRTTEPIAIVGLGCRFPMAPSPEAFARALAVGTSAIREIPRERWDVDAYYSPVPGTPGTMCTRHGGFIDGVDLFDAAFFGISPREAEAMDPQQRLLLEVAWEALESAGVPKEALARSQTGVFIGLSALDYGFFLGEQQVDGYTNTGIALSVAAGRLSSFFDLRGPSEVIDTACSGSLVAVHRACESLRAHETDAALAGGVNLLLHPMLHIGFSQAGMLARDGHCKTFDARADGYTRGEGCGLLLLKRLSDAQRDGDTIHALVTGSAINHNGRGNGLTAPNGPAQEELIVRALMMSGRDAAAVDYVEAHGTGTPLGDPQELFALGSVLRQRSDAADRRVLVGSVKTNIGHLEAAAGIAGLIKLVLMIQRGEIFPHINMREVNPEIDLDALRLEIPTERRAWPLRNGTRVGGVSSFGFSGTNAHVVVEAPPPAPARDGAPRALHVWSASTRSRASLVALAEHWIRHLDETTDSLADVCFTSNVGRHAFDHRVAVVTASKEHLGDALSDFVVGKPNDDVHASANVGGRSPAAAATTTESNTAAAWASGERLDWRSFHGSHAGRKVGAPTYPFERSRHWLAERADTSRTPRTAAEHPLLGRRIASASAAAQFESSLGVSSPACLSGHRIYGLPLFPATGCIELALLAGRAVLGDVEIVLDDMVFERALVLPEEGSCRVQVVVTAGAEGAFACEVYSQDPGARDVAAPWTRHARTTLRRLDPNERPPHESASAATTGIEAIEADPVDTERHYRALGERGMVYTGEFRSLTELHRGPPGSGVGFGRVHLAASSERAGAYMAHPAVLDSCLQVIGAGVETRFSAGGGSRMAYLPVAASRIRLRRRIGGAATSQVNVRLAPSGFEYAADVCVFDEHGAPAVEIEGLQMRGVDRARLREGGAEGGEHDVLRKLEDAPAEGHLDILVDFVRQEAAAVVGVDASEMSDALMFFELGISSLGSVELQYRLQKNLRCDLSGIALDYESVKTLADGLLARFARTEHRSANAAEGGLP